MFPIGSVAAGVILTAWSRLAMFSIGALVALVVTALPISESEELPYRGIVLDALLARVAGFVAAILEALMFESTS